MAKAKKTGPSIDLAAREFIDLKNEKTKIERRCDELKRVLETYLDTLPEKAAILSGWKFSLVEMTREFFKLSEAKEKIDKKILKPFITVSTTIQLRTFWNGGEEKDAA